jgi:hypothetical protein
MLEHFFKCTSWGGGLGEEGGEEEKFFQFLVTFRR